METTLNSPAMKAIVLSFPLNPRKISEKLISDIEEINSVDAIAVYGSNMKRVNGTSTQVKLYLPNFGDGHFSTAFSVSGEMDEDRLTRLTSVYGLAASLRLFNFIHYIAGSHLVVCITISDADHTKEGIQALADLRKFLQIQNPNLNKNRKK